MKAPISVTIFAMTLTVMVCSSCVSSSRVDLVRTTLREPIEAKDMLSDVGVSAELTELREVVRQPGPDLVGNPGHILAQVFTGGMAAPWQVGLVSAKSSQLNAGGDLLFTGPAKFSYALSVTLSGPDGQKTILSATGTTSTGWRPDQAWRSAIENAAVDLSRQISAYRRL